MDAKNKTHATEKSAAISRAPERAEQTSKQPLQQASPDVALKRVMSDLPSALGPEDILSLQAAIGNRAVQGILAERIKNLDIPDPQSRPVMQAKLEVGAADDAYEQEADRVAASVITTQPAAQVQRQLSEDEDEEDDEEAIQTKPLASHITPLVQRSSAGGLSSIGSGLESSIEGARRGGQPLPVDLRSRMERAFGADFSQVRVHADAESDGLNRSLQARAFTTGQHLFFKRGQYNPDNAAGQQLIAHELTHVVQQQGGSIQQKGRTRQPLVHRANSSNVIQRATSLDGPFDAAYADTLLSESQGRTARTAAGHALDHLAVGALKIKRGFLAAVPSKLKELSEVYNVRKVASFYTDKDNMKTILTNFLADGTVTTELAKLKAGQATEYQKDGFAHGSINIVVIQTVKAAGGGQGKRLTLIPGKSTSSFLKIQSTTDATPNLHIQTMYPK